MALTDNNAGYGSDLLWIILFFMVMGNGGFGFGGNANDATLQRGFDQNSIMNGINGITAGIGSLSQQLYNNQITDMQNAFAMQSQFAQCCCDNKTATLQTQAIVQQEGAATRLAIENQTQAILDKLCQQEIEQLRSANVSLQNQLNMANLAASQTAQTQQIISALTPAA